MVKIWGVDALSAFGRGFDIALKPALIAALVSYIIGAGWVVSPISWQWANALVRITSLSVSISIAVSLVTGFLVLILRIAMASAPQTVLEVTCVRPSSYPNLSVHLVLRHTGMGPLGHGDQM